MATDASSDPLSIDEAARRAPQIPTANNRIRNGVRHLDDLSVQAQKVAIQNAIMAELRRHIEDGRTVTEMRDATGIRDDTIRSNLERLRAVRECYKVKRDGNTWIWFANGQPIHKVKRHRIEDDASDTVVDIHLAQGRQDRLFVHVLEKKWTLLNGMQTEGGIILPLSLADKIIAVLQELKGAYAE